MKINWYPGHMHKARKELAKTIPEVNLVIELLDARAPYASENPLLRELRGGLPCVRILNKSDLADPEITRQWCRHYSMGHENLCLTNGMEEQLTKKELVRACFSLAPAQPSGVNRHQALITGIPNVGKSSLLNQILKRKVAKTGNEPAVTRGQQRVKLDDDWYLIDTPGMMWPNLENQEAAYHLACIGSIRNTALEIEDIAWFLADLLLLKFYPSIEQRYQLDKKPLSTENFFEQLAKSHGCLAKGGQPDWYKVSELLLNDFRSGRLGRISLESLDNNGHYR